MPKPCARCGSDKIIPDIPMWDHIGDMGVRAGQAAVEVLGKPAAFIFTDKAIGQLSVNICGDCGHADMFVDNPRELWDKYQKSKQ